MDLRFEQFPFRALCIFLRNNMIPFSPPDIYQEVIDEVVDTLKSGWITTGPKTKLFEKKIAEYTNVESVLCLNSATSGLELILRWFGIGPGDEVIVPAYTYCATVNVVMHCGARPVLVDVGPDFNMNMDLLEEKINENTKVIMPVDFAGLPCEYDALIELVSDERIRSMFQVGSKNQEMLGRILILSDAAHSFGARYKQRVSGSFTDISVFSFHAVKNLTTAEGGAVCLNLPGMDNKEVYKQLCITSLHGQNKDALAKTQVGSWKYDIVEAGYKWNMTDIQASLGLVALKHYDSRTLKRRRDIFDAYSELLQPYAWSELPEYQSPEKQSSYHLFPLRIKDINEDQRDRIVQSIFEKGVSVNVHFMPIPMLSAYSSMDYDPKDYPVAYDNYRREISLPVYVGLSDEQVKQVVKAVVRSVGEILE